MKHLLLLTLFSMGPFGAAHRCAGEGGGTKRPTPWNLSHISHNDETWNSYTSPKEDQKSNI